jgi:hypothetical protein
MPYPDSRWPIEKDGIAWRWQGSAMESAVEKYDRAFRSDMLSSTWERQHHGIATNPESWWGHCNGWAGAATNVLEPKHAVTHNGARFEVSDIKALLAEVYYSGDYRFVGSRCNAKAITFGPDGRVTDPACADTNAGSLHVAVANMIGRHGKPLVMDLAADYRVFNDIVTGYDSITTTITEQKAAQLVGDTGPQYTRNVNAAHFVQAQTKLTFLPENAIAPSREPVGARTKDVLQQMTLDYVLELDADKRVIGGEWIAGSLSMHPDFMWISLSSASTADQSYENPYVTATNVRILYQASIE